MRIPKYRFLLFLNCKSWEKNHPNHLCGVSKLHQKTGTLATLWQNCGKIWPNTWAKTRQLGQVLWQNFDKLSDSGLWRLKSTRVQSWPLNYKMLEKNEMIMDTDLSDSLLAGIFGGKKSAGKKIIKKLGCIFFFFWFSTSFSCILNNNWKEKIVILSCWKK